jgi:cytochrome c oxidase subunit 4
MDTTTHEISHAAGDHSDDDHSAHDVSKHVKTYLLVGGLLLAFTALTVGLSYVNFGSDKANMIVALFVATIKASMVAAIFMHLSSEKWTIYRFLLVTVVFVMGLFGLTLLAWLDYIRM